MAKYTVEYGVKKTVKLPASSLKDARKLAYKVISRYEPTIAHIYRGDNDKNGVDGNGEYDAWALFILSHSKNFAGIVYEVSAHDGLVKRYPVNPDGTIGELLEMYWDD